MTTQVMLQRNSQREARYTCLCGHVEAQSYACNMAQLQKDEGSVRRVWELGLIFFET